LRIRVEIFVINKINVEIDVCLLVFSLIVNCFNQKIRKSETLKVSDTLVSGLSGKSVKFWSRKTH